MIYLDTSSFVKLIWTEPGSSEIAELLADRSDLVSSTLLAVEARRAVLRQEPGALPRVDLVLERVEMIGMSDAVLESASRLPDRCLRTLYAIHLATALLIREDVETLLSYDERLLTAATAHKIPTASPAEGPYPA